MGIRVAYGKKDNIEAAIMAGVIPKDSIIFTSDQDESTEIFFYDSLGILKEASGRPSGTEELSLLAERISANKSAIEQESAQRGLADSDIMAAVTQIESSQITLRDLVDQMGIEVDSTVSDAAILADKVADLDTAVADIGSRLNAIEENGTSELVERQIDTLRETKLDKSEAVEAPPGNVDKLFGEVFGLGSLTMPGDNVTISGSDVTIEGPRISLQTNPYGSEAYWLPGLRVDAPAGRSKSAVYQTMNEASGIWSEEKQFDGHKDGDDFILLYAQAAPEKTTFCQRWRFDWDNDGTFEQLVTINVVNAQLV